MQGCRKICSLAAILSLQALCTMLVGCFGHAKHLLAPPSPTVAGINQADVSDIHADSEAAQLLDAQALFTYAERIRREQRPKNLPPKRSILALSGGGSYGAYTAGLLVGWTQTGTRPQFDVVTGISTGALIAPLAFLGPGYDPQVEALYTNVTNSDLYRIKKNLRTIFGEALADNTPLVQRLEQICTPELLRAIAVEHSKGRRLYVGTTELDSRKQVIWDLGAIACGGSEDDLQLFRQILQASASIPGFFPPVRIRVNIDGKIYEERHVDGGVTASVFFRPPYIAPELRNEPEALSLYDADLFILQAGKSYPDAEAVRLRSIRIVAAGVSTLLYTAARGDLLMLYTATVLTGMNYYVAPIPQDLPVENSSTEFNPEEMLKLYNEGVRQMQKGTAFRRTPPGLEKGEGVSLRAGRNLIRTGQTGLIRDQSSDRAGAVGDNGTADPRRLVTPLRLNALER